MPKIIRDRQLVDDHWQFLKAGEAVPADGDVVVPLSMLVADTGALLSRPGKLGVRIEAGEGIAEIVPHLASLALVAVDFPTMYDGRGLSYARELRERHGYRGEIRATGDVKRDVVHGMHRCGINAFVVRDGQSPENLLAAFSDFSTGYQPDVHEPRPIYRR